MVYYLLMYLVELMVKTTLSTDGNSYVLVRVLTMNYLQFSI